MVIGGGSGGLACAQEASKFLHPNRVALIDYVTPTLQNTVWGLGGTCVNVGCIPKKLMHHASLIGETLDYAKSYGWYSEMRPIHNWNILVSGIQDYIHSLNWGYRGKLREKKVDYLNAFARFVDQHTVECSAKSTTKRFTSKRFVVCIGGRPQYLEIPGKEYCITSDDIFSLKNSPGKTLVVGASYVALECAGFLNGLGYDTTVMARSNIFLRRFDRQMSDMVVEYMETRGTKFIRNCNLMRIEKQKDGRLLALWKSSSPKDNEQPSSDVFDTVLIAIGRYPQTSKLGLENAGVLTAPSGKIPVVNECTNVSHIYALGDVIEGQPELTPVAIRAGKLLAQRLYGASSEMMDYKNVPTTVFTPLEYGSCGYTEEEAIEKHGQENIEVYHAYYKPLEWNLSLKEENVCYLKVITNREDCDRLIGVHILGPNAGEIIQGLAIAIRCRATKFDLDSTLGIHPTIAEEFTKLDITKRSGMDARKTGC